VKIFTKKDLLNHYKAKVAEIPEMRQCLAYPEEDAVKCLTHFNDNCENLCRTELMFEAVTITKGQANPAFINDLISEWLELK
jgi:hypothetical protein